MMIKEWNQKRFLLFTLSLVTSCLLYAQSIHYSRQTVTPPEYDRMQLINNIDGNHHLLFFKKSKPPLLFVFDGDLQLIAKKELPVAIDSFDRLFIPFKNYWLLYLHKKKSTKHELWKITGQGEAQSLSGPFQAFVDSVFKKKTSTLQLFNKEEQLTLITNTYYDELKALSVNVVTADSNLKLISAHNLSLPFNAESTSLIQSTLIGNDLFILRSVRQVENYALELIKADLNTGKLLRKTFESILAFTRSSGFRYTAADSSLLVQSVIGRQMFVSRLDLSLKELAPVTILAPKFSYDFFLLDGKVQQWVAISDPPAYRSSKSYTTTSYTPYETPTRNTGYSSGYPLPDNSSMSPELRATVDEARRQEAYVSAYRSSDGSLGSYSSSPSVTTRSYPAENLHHPIRFSVFTKNFKLESDSVLNKEKNPAIVTNSTFARVTEGHQSYLLFKQDLPRSKKGLVLVSAEGNKITTRDITVYDKYEYLLQYAQAADNEPLIMPYLNNKEVGLVRLSFTNGRK